MQQLVIKSILIVLAGIILGGVAGYYGSCSTGTCPLTANPWRGAIYGGLMAAMFVAAMWNNPANRKPQDLGERQEDKTEDETGKKATDEE